MREQRRSKTFACRCVDILFFAPRIHSFILLINVISFINFLSRSFTLVSFIISWSNSYSSFRPFFYSCILSFITLFARSLIYSIRSFVHSFSFHNSFLHQIILSFIKYFFNWFIIHYFVFFPFFKIPLDDLLGSPSLPLPASTATAGGNGGSASGSGLSRLQPPDSDSESDTKTSDYHRRLKHVQVYQLILSVTLTIMLYNFLQDITVVLVLN